MKTSSLHLNPQETLSKAVENAISNGWEGWKDFAPVLPIDRPSIEKIFVRAIWIHRYQILFSPDFARALWGENKETTSNLVYKFRKENWIFHLQRMVIKDDPIGYLRFYLDDYGGYERHDED